MGVCLTDKSKRVTKLNNSETTNGRLFNGPQHPKYYRERPNCRIVILELLDEYNCTLEQLYQDYKLQLSDGILTQCRKMILEKTLTER